jgi:F-type H+-transporting ATPase subunit b
LKIQIIKWLTLLCMTTCLAWQGGQVAFAFDQPAATQTASASTASAHEQKQDSEDINEFRHAPSVQMLARVLGISTESAAKIFEIINSGILIFTIFFFVIKIVPKAIRSRSANIQKKLDEARLETKTANERLGEVEAKLAKIGDEIEAIRQQTERDMVQDEKRIKQALEDERQRIVQSAEQEIESAGAAAKRELKRFAAELAVDNAAKRIQLSYDSDKALVERFGKDLASNHGKGGQN